MFVLLCHTFMNFYWRKDLCQADLSDTLNMFVKYAENFLEPFGKKVSAQNMGFCQNIPTWFWASFFQNLNLFHFSWHIIWLVCRMVTIFLLTQESRLRGPFRYLENVRTVRRKFSRNLWKKVSAQKIRFCQNIQTWFWASFFQNLIFFHFSWHIIWWVSCGHEFFTDAKI